MTARDTADLDPAKPGQRTRSAGRPGLRARAEVALWRQGWAWPVAGALLLAALLIELWQVQGLQQQLAEAQASAALPAPAARAMPAGAGVTAAPVATPQALAALAQALGDGMGSPTDAPDTGAAVAKLLALGRRHGIDLAQAQYQASSDSQAGLQRLQISLPGQAGYAQARAFLQDLLQALPQASVDLFELKRTQRDEAMLAFSIKLSLWQLAQPLAPANPGRQGLTAEPAR